jgi:hypothetical protein
LARDAAWRAGEGAADARLASTRAAWVAVMVSGMATVAPQDGHVVFI